jgi:glutamate--cysteine ligase
VSVVTRDTPTRLHDCAAVHGYVKRVCFKTGPPHLVGTELEWLVAFEDAPEDIVPIGLLRSLLDPLPPPPHGSRITYEPGGQLELSSPPARGPSACWRALAADVAHVLPPLRNAGIALLPTAIDPYRRPHRQLVHPRYDAMESHFAAIGAHLGPVMMNSTAATQVNLDIGADDADAARRWRVLHAIGPTISAGFANSPIHAGVDTGWKSMRQRVWQQLDPQRTRIPAGPDPVRGWADYALDADLMLRRRPRSEDWTMPPGKNFRAWVTGTGDDLPTTDDLEYHLTTLFPPVRPRGWLEVRYVDSLPLRWWPVPTAVLSALLDDPEAGQAALDATAGVSGLAHRTNGNGRRTDPWEVAARVALEDPTLATAARTCFEAAEAALVRAGADPELVDLVRDYTSTYVAAGSCPADDLTRQSPEAP